LLLTMILSGLQIREQPST